MELAEHWRAAYHIEGRATETDLVRLSERLLELEPPRPMPPPLLCVGDGIHLVLSDDLGAHWIAEALPWSEREAPWLQAHHMHRALTAGAIAAAILGQHRYTFSWPFPDLTGRQETIRMILLAGWLTFGPEAGDDPLLRLPDQLARYGDWPLWACRIWLRLSAMQLAERWQWTGRAS